MIETDFGWALAKMRDGYKVRRADWVNDRFMEIADGSLTMTHPGRKPFTPTFTAESVMAYDWELVP